MELDILRKIGLTDGEIKVYESLLFLGKSSTGKIMKKSGISSSKVYLILEKLVKKGLVSFIIENNVKKFQITNPKSILDYVENKKRELDIIKEDFKKVIPQIRPMLGNSEEESAQVYKGIRGIDVAFNNIINELRKGDEYLFFSVSKEELTDKRFLKFFEELQKERIRRGLHVRAILDVKLKNIFAKILVFHKNSKLKYCSLTLPTGITIGKNRIVIPILGDEIIAYEIISHRVAERYQNFFEKMWEKGKP